MLGSIIGGAMGVGGAIFGGISASKAMKKAKKMVQQEMADNQNWYDRRYNEDATQRADAQRILTEMNDQLKQRSAAMAGTQAVMGGTEEAMASQRAAQTQALADATSQIATAAQSRKDGIENQYMANRSSLNEQLRNLEVGKAQAVSQAVQGVAQAGSDIAGVFSKAGNYGDI